jgi:hypothetical protein
MNTTFLLMAQYNGRAIVPLDWCAETISPTSLLKCSSEKF